MEQLSEKSQYMSIEDIRNHPELIAHLLLKDTDVSVILEKRGKQIRYSYLKTYDKESVRILEEAKKELKILRKKGYTREQAFKEFSEALDDVERLNAEFNRQISGESSRHKKIQALKGKYVHVKTDSEAFAFRKQEDLYIEEHLCRK